MDAHALLTSQGWRGTGHSLHPTCDKTGLSRPLLVSQKTNNLGLGKKQHKTSDMWWMNAFDKSLQGLDTSEKGKVVQTIANGGLDMVVKGGAKWVGSGGGLYASFVRGDCLSGTITPEEEYDRNREFSNQKMSTDEDRKESKKERTAKTAVKRGLSMQESAAEETPEVERENMIVKRSEESRSGKAAKRVKKSHESAVEKGRQQEEVNEVSVDDVETKEKRKERKRQKKLLRDAVQKTVEISAEGAKKKKRRKE